jgi:hypothetical protein
MAPSRHRRRHPRPPRRQLLRRRRRVVLPPPPRRASTRQVATGSHHRCRRHRPPPSPAANITESTAFRDSVGSCCHPAPPAPEGPRVVDPGSRRWPGGGRSEHADRPRMLSPRRSVSKFVDELADLRTRRGRTVVVPRRPTDVGEQAQVVVDVLGAAHLGSSHVVPVSGDATRAARRCRRPASVGGRPSTGWEAPASNNSRRHRVSRSSAAAIGGTRTLARRRRRAGRPRR